METPKDTVSQRCETHMQESINWVGKSDNWDLGNVMGLRNTWKMRCTRVETKTKNETRVKDRIKP